MADLWEIPPFPDRGDLTAEEIRKAKSAAIDQWEQVENRLAELNERFIQGTVTAFGTGKIFMSRLAILRRTAQAYFVKHPNQIIEGQFWALCTTVNKMADRRNDIAHGIVTPYTSVVDETGFPDLTTTTYVLAPARYDVKRMEDNKKVTFLYSSRELSLIGHRFLTLNAIIHEFTERFVL